MNNVHVDELIIFFKKKLILKIYEIKKNFLKQIFLPFFSIHHR